MSLSGIKAKSLVSGNKVIDHERIWGLADSPLELIAVYEVSQGLIQRACFFSNH